MCEVVLDMENQLPKLEATAEDLGLMLGVIEKEILHVTRAAVSKGHKWFGAAILDGTTLDTVIANTNNELDCPLFHGEVYTIIEWSKMIPAEERGAAAKSSIFLSTHEPCCMCISSIVWSGFQKVYYLFPYSLTSAQGIPHDINTMHELWGVPTYRKQSKFCSTACIMDMVDELPDSDEKTSLKERVDKLVSMYEEISDFYHTEKAGNAKNSLAFG